MVQPILLSVVIAMIPIAAHAIDIHTPTVTVPQVNVPQVKAPQISTHTNTQQLKLPGGNNGKSISSGDGNSRYKDIKESNSPLGAAQTTTVGPGAPSAGGAQADTAGPRQKTYARGIGTSG